MRPWQYFLPLTAAIVYTAKSFSVATIYKYKSSGISPANILAAPILVNNPCDGAIESNSTVSLVKQLNLTLEQQQQIERIRRQYQQNILRRKQELESLKQQLTQMMAGTNTVAEIRAKNQELVLLRQEIGKLRFESMLATREILTPEQRQKFREIIESQ